MEVPAHSRSRDQKAEIAAGVTAGSTVCAHGRRFIAMCGGEQHRSTVPHADPAVRQTALDAARAGADRGDAAHGDIDQQRDIGVDVVDCLRKR